MTETPEVRPQIYMSFSPSDENAAAKDLGAFNMPMVCEQIRGTESEVMQYKGKLEKERTYKWLEWTRQNKRILSCL